MKFLATSLLLYLSFLLDSRANALKISGVRTGLGYGRVHGLGEGLLGRRSVLSSAGDLRNDGDLKYYANITLNDEAFPVLIDTGRCVCTSLSL